MNVIKIPDPELDELINTDERWLKYKDEFPFDEPYPIQKTTIALIDYAIEKGVKNIVLQSPVGTGKTVLCVTVAKAFENFYYLTPKIGLANQVQRDFSEIKQVKGRGNFYCLVDKGVKCDRARCVLENKYKCKEKKSCPYYVQKEVAINSHQVVSNPAYMNRVLLSPNEVTENGKNTNFDKRLIGVWDESHGLEDHFINMGKSYITDYDYINIQNSLGIDSEEQTRINMNIDFEDHGLVVGEVVDLYDDWKKCIGKFKLDDRVKDQPLDILEKTKKMINIGNRLMNILKMMNVPFKNITSLNISGEEIDINQYDRSEFNFRNVSVNKSFGKKSNKIIFSPVTVMNAKKHINRVADINLFVSATILDFSVFCKSLGLSTDQGETVGILVDESPFDEERRIIYHTPAGYMNKNKIDDTLPEMAKKIEDIIDQNHPNHRGIILPYTHKIKEYLYDYLIKKFPDRIITHGRDNDPVTNCPYCNRKVFSDEITGEDGKIFCKCGESFFKYARDVVIDRFMRETDKPLILISTYINEGFDMKGDIARFAIICKVPYPNLGDESIRKRLVYEQDNYRQFTDYSCDYTGEQSNFLIEGKQVYFCNDLCMNWGCERCKGWSNMKTAAPLVQMTGRVVRNMDDWAMIYVMDQGFKRFVKSHEWLFPSYFLDSIRWFKK